MWVEDYLCSLTEGGGCGLCVCDEKEVLRFKLLSVINSHYHYQVPEPWRQTPIPQDEMIDTTVADDITTWHDDKEAMWTNEEQDDPGWSPFNSTSFPPIPLPWLT